MRVVVIGMGGVGSAAARFLARDGPEVIGLARAPLGHAQPSACLRRGAMRCTYEGRRFIKPPPSQDDDASGRVPPKPIQPQQPRQLVPPPPAHPQALIV